MSETKGYNFIPKKGEVKVTVNTLRLRKGKPNNEGVEKAGEAHKNDILQYVGYVLNGKPVDEISKWYLNPHGDFFWAGGVKEMKVRPETRQQLPLFVWPARKVFQRLSQPHGVAWSANNNKQHTGADILVPAGEKVFACASGKVVRVGNLDAHGRWAQYIILNHDADSYCTAYLHVNPKPKIKVGSKIKAKEVIASVANIGAPHLHFNVWRGAYNALAARGALPFPENKGKIDPKSDPAFPHNFVDPMIFNYDYLE